MMQYWLEAHLTSSFFFYIGAVATSILMLRLLMASSGAGRDSTSSFSLAVWAPIIFLAGFGWMGHSYASSYEMPIDLVLIGAVGFGAMMTMLGCVGILTAKRYRHGTPEKDSTDEQTKQTS